MTVAPSSVAPEKLGMHKARLALSLVALLTGAVGAFPWQEVLGNDPARINTVGYEDSPFISPDGSRFYFMYTPWQTWPDFFGLEPVLKGPPRIGHHINPDLNPWEDSDLYVAVRQPDGKWAPPLNLPFNTPYADCCAMTWDNARFYYQRTQWPNSALTDLYRVDCGSQGVCAQPVSLGPTLNGSESSESNPHVSADDRTIYFTSDRPGGYGKTDLYVAERGQDGNWLTPRNMGPVINSAEREDQIWVSRDGRTAYFNRDPVPTIFRTVMAHGEWTRPEPVLFGGVQYPGAEVSVTDDGKRLYFAWVRSELGDIVIVWAPLMPDGTWGTPLAGDQTAIAAPNGLTLIVK